MTRQDLQQMVGAHDAVWEAWWPTLIALPRRAAHRQLGGSFPSVFATTRHLVDAERYWQELIDGEPPFERTVSTTRSLRWLADFWREVQARRLAWLATANPRAPVTFVPDAGGTATVRAWQCLFHVIGHAHFHRGQLVSQYRALGRTPPSRHLLGPFFAEF